MKIKFQTKQKIYKYQKWWSNLFPPPKTSQNIKNGDFFFTAKKKPKTKQNKKQTNKQKTNYRKF